jgi:hypothetical protein
VSFDLAETLDLLARTPAVVDRLLRGTAEAWHARDEGPETWSPRAVVAHLVFGEETDWVPRGRLILEHGEARPFDPFDMAGHERFADWPLELLLDRFAELRAASLETVRGWRLAEADLARTGRHPTLGTVTLEQLLATWAAHDLNHLGQIARVMAKRYADEVGPWRQFLSILGPR